MQLLRTSHPGPTAVVTTIAFLLSHTLWPLGQSAIIAFTIFLGQLCIGWSNDVVDEETDRKEGRSNKPLAQGLIARATVINSIYITLTLCVLLSLFGPLGIRGGLVHLLGVGCGVSYNFYFKRTIFSPLPYIIALAALPTSIALSKNHFAPFWTVLVGGLFGLASHFANVLKDIDEDRVAGVLGLPQRLGSTTSKAIAGASFVLISLILNSKIDQSWLIPIAVLALFAIIGLPLKYSFAIIMAIAVVNVLLLATTNGGLLQ